MENIKKLQELAQNKDMDGFKKIYSTLTEEKKNEIITSDTYKNVNWHEYSGCNLLFLYYLEQPWIFGTFAQWRKNGKMVKKGSKGIKILAPIFENKKSDDKEEVRIKFFKDITVFHERNVEAMV